MKKPEMQKIPQAAEKALEWVRSEEGKREICAIIRDAERVTTNLSEARRVDEKNLEKPITM